MALTDVFRAAADDDTGNFDISESTDLNLHVRQCARRYRALDRKLTLVVRLVLVLVGLHIAASIPGGLAMLLKWFAGTM